MPSTNLTFNEDDYQRWNVKVELEMLMPAPAGPTNRELSEDEWTSLVGPLSIALYEEGVHGCTVVNHNDERDAKKWCIMRDSAIRDESNNHIPHSFKLVSPTLPYHVLGGFEQYIPGFDTAFRVLDAYGCERSSSCSTLVYTSPTQYFTPALVDKPVDHAFTLNQAKYIAQLVLRSALPLQDLARTLGRNCVLPWDMRIGDGHSGQEAYRQQLERIGSIDGARSYEDLAAYMSSSELDDLDSSVPRRPMWDFSSLLDDSGMVQCSLGPCAKSGLDVVMWVHFTCMMAFAAVSRNGGTGRINLCRLFKFEQQLYVEMVHNTQREADSAWKNLYKLIKNPDIYNGTDWW
ncbi:hypothetical protein F4803DRAFT_555015 [Xylaria telfairii]|nr:hypothetical protein F4803DRAFT_555015 [Xylaria telfairii]